MHFIEVLRDWVTFGMARKKQFEHQCGIDNLKDAFSSRVDH